MTDPIIAEIDLSNVEARGHVPVYLSDAPKVADFLEAAKKSLLDYIGWWGVQNQKPKKDFEDWVEDKRESTGGDAAQLELLRAIRAIEPEWSP